MSLQYFEEEKYFYQNVFLTFYLNIVCKNIVCDVGLTLSISKEGKVTYLCRITPSIYRKYFEILVAITVYVK